MSATRTIIGTVAGTTLGLLVAASTADAQGTDSTSVRRGNAWEFLAASGALVPTGAQRSALKDASMSTAQLSYVVRSRFAVTTSVGWARSRDLLAEGRPKLSVFTYDVGVEARAPRWIETKPLTFTPFAGAGAGGRSYDHRGVDVDATHNLAGYVAAGGELGMGRIRLRLEARDYVSQFKSFGGGGAVTRNDVTVLAGLRFTRGRARE